MVIAEYLEEATDATSPWFSDGAHLNPAGIRIIAPHVAALHQRLHVDAVVSDSMLCARVGSYKDKEAAFIHDALPTLTLQPQWAASFSQRSFDTALWKLWDAHKIWHGARVAVLIAGNDLWGDAVSSEVALAMEDTLTYWRGAGVHLLFVDCVPASCYRY